MEILRTCYAFLKSTIHWLVDSGDVGVNLFVQDAADTAVDVAKSREQRVEKLAAFREKLLPFAQRLEIELPSVEEIGADVSGSPGAASLLYSPSKSPA